MLPRRSATTHTEALDDELCVYDWQRKEVHALNATAARVWQMCDGRTSVRTMTTTLAAELGLPEADDLVRLALAVLDEKHLLDGGVPASRGQDQMSRRTLIGRLSATAAMLPIVTSIVAPTALQAQSLSSQTFSFTGGAQTFNVPAGVTSIMIDGYGAGGGAAFSTPGKGGRVQASIGVTPGEPLTIHVGGAGGAGVISSGPGLGGFNGGGNGGAGNLFGGSGGGGASDVSRASTPLVIAGGGGGTSGAASANGGDGGGLVGAAGSNGIEPDLSVSGGGGGGGTQSAGGSGGPASPLPFAAGGQTGGNGASRTGGVGGSAQTSGAGGGGGGYFGGGGGGSDNNWFQPYSGGGGGGSSYADPGATSVMHTAGVQTGNGRVIISW